MKKMRTVAGFERGNLRNNGGDWTGAVRVVHK